MQQILEVSSWSAWKTLLRNKVSLSKYNEMPSVYDLYLEDGIFVWHYSMYKNGGADQIDFETNYKNLRYFSRGFFFAANTWSLAAAATDVFTITGSATKLIKINSLILSGIRSTAAVTDLLIQRRSSNNTGGSSSILTNVLADDNSALPTAVCKAYTANPATIGTVVGNFGALKFFMDTTNNDTPIVRLEYLSPIILDGVDDILALTFSGGNTVGASLSATIMWSEE
jgi:hypothetical protein